MLLANFNGKEHLRHRAVSLRQHGFLVYYGSNHSRITYHLRNVFRVYTLKIAISRYLSIVFWLQTDNGWTPSKYQRNPIYTTLNSTFSGLYNSVADNKICLHSFSRCCLPNLRNHAKFRAVRGRSRSSTLFKVIELDRLDANRKSIICNFLLIIVTVDYLNIVPISRYRRIKL